MRAARYPSWRRPGLSLLEVLVALTIFLLAFVILGRLVIFGSDRALQTQHEVQAADLCQTKMAEVIAGAVPLTAVSAVPFNEDQAWQWSLDCEQSDFPGLWNVTVRVSRQGQRGTEVVCTLNEKVLDPQIHGNLQDAPPGSGSASSSGSSSSSPSSSPSSKPAGGMGGS